MAFTAKDVQTLRQATGAGMMDAKKALEANDGDFEAAKQWLREKGLAASSNRGDRENTQGVVALELRVVNGSNVGAIVKLKSETDFVAGSDQFKQEAATLAALVAEKGESAVVERATILDDLKIVLKENIELGTVARIEAAPDSDAALLRHWAAKEAVVKAIGRGIAYGLHNIELAPADGDELVLARLEGPAGPHVRWRLAGVALGDGAYGALAWDGPVRRIECYRGD